MYIFTELRFEIVFRWQRFIDGHRYNLKSPLSPTIPTYQLTTVTIHVWPSLFVICLRNIHIIYFAKK